MDEIIEDNEDREAIAKGAGRNLAPIIIGVWAFVAVALIGGFILIVNRDPSPTTVGTQQADHLKVFQDRLKQNPNDLEALSGMGQNLADAKRPDEAITYFEKILALDANNITALADLGSIQMELGKGDDALANIEKALKIKPDFDYGLFVKANYLFNVKRDFQGSLDILKSLEKSLPAGAKLNSVKENIAIVEQQLNPGSGTPAPPQTPAN